MFSKMKPSDLPLLLGIKMLLLQKAVIAGLPVLSTKNFVNYLEIRLSSDFKLLERLDIFLGTIVKVCLG